MSRSSEVNFTKNYTLLYLFLYFLLTFLELHMKLGHQKVLNPLGISRSASCPFPPPKQCRNIKGKGKVDSYSN